MAPAPRGEDVIVDSGVLIGIERGSFNTFANLLAALGADGKVALIPAPVLTEVWRDGAQQANLARALKTLMSVSCDEHIAKRAGTLLARTGGTNSVDAIVVATAESRGCPVVTGDSVDLSVLALHSVGVTIVSF